MLKMKLNSKGWDYKTQGFPMYHFKAVLLRALEQFREFGGNFKLQGRLPLLLLFSVVLEDSAKAKSHEKEIKDIQNGSET
jgi:hypothetical protein